MGQDMFHFIVYVNGSIIQGENEAYFQSNASLMFRNTRVSSLYELKQVILSHLGADGPREIRRLAYRFQAVTPDDWLEYRPSWLSEDRHLWITFEVHKRIMQDRFMEFLAEVRHIGGSATSTSHTTAGSPSHSLQQARHLWNVCVSGLHLSTKADNNPLSMSKSLMPSKPPNPVSSTYDNIDGGGDTTTLPRRSSNIRGT
ncbi:hypothetical protein PIB30_000683 [Stylosanthes scabra]|uniref:Uncharacterized protein n=1 Tax=Stylosanthes scabra TaxID=79078 RepID=A0ABU6Y2S8_9FABA|nr:hypothetical protein [Stylosanthes scabra]